MVRELSKCCLSASPPVLVVYIGTPPYLRVFHSGNPRRCLKTQIQANTHPCSPGAAHSHSPGAIPPPEGFLSLAEDVHPQPLPASD